MQNTSLPVEQRKIVRTILFFLNHEIAVLQWRIGLYKILERLYTSSKEDRSGRIHIVLFGPIPVVTYTQIQ